jgi:hypothetical protein
MAITTASIVNALAPGIALTSGIFYNSGLQTRLNLITGRARDLNREARTLLAQPNYDPKRLESVRLQVDMLWQRAKVIQRSALAAHAALVMFLATIMTMLVLGLFDRSDVQWLPVVLFTCGLGSLGYAMFLAIGEMSLSISTLFEDVRTSFPEAPKEK